jgi:uncharacterized protein with von Willebrand factor type A (vWA) domain
MASPSAHTGSAGDGTAREAFSGATFFWNALLFTRAVRAAGIETDPGGAIDYSRALSLVDIGDREQVRACGLALFVRRRDEVPVYDEVFRRFWDLHELAIDATELADIARPAIDDGQSDDRHSERIEAAANEPSADARGAASERLDGDEGAEDDGVEGAAERAWTMRERFRHKPFERMSQHELNEDELLIDRLRPRLEMRRTRRQELHRHGRVIATRQVFRRNIQHGGDLVEWLWRRPARRPRSTVIICDISGSMDRHSRLLMRFAMALRRASRVRTEAFVFGTHLTRVTRELASHDPDLALAQVSATVNDWSGGTRIGESLRQFNQSWARRVLRSSGVVIIVSDGWDRGDPGLVAAEMARLQRSCHRLIWLNPLAGTDSYQPLAAGMAAAYRFIDDLVAVSDMASLQGLAHLLARMAEDRSRRPDRVGVPTVHRPRAGSSDRSLAAARP